MLGDLDVMNELVAQAGSFRPEVRSRQPLRYPDAVPIFPEVPVDIAGALRRASTTKEPSPPQRVPLSPSWREYLRFWELPEKQRALDAKYAAEKSAFDTALREYREDIAMRDKWAAKVSAFQLRRTALQHQWAAAEREWNEQRRRDIEAWNALKTAYARSEESEPVEHYFALSITTIPTPQWCPDSHELHYDPDNRILVVDYQLPHFADLTVQKPRELKAGTKFVAATQKEAREFWERVPYFLMLRVLWEICQIDEAQRVHLVCGNGFVVRNDPATGHRRTDVIMSVAVSPDDVRDLRLDRLDPEACFRRLKGVAAPKLGELVPVTPVIEFDRNDRRFVEGRAVLGEVGGQNLATMDWQEFEHLVRELFEKEFASEGAEVRVTQASRDRGVDAVIFDPDPVRGGKYVVQAKRYAHTVDVAAVRDLFGTVQAEGANKGILVTTSNFGRDSYEFARGKPLTLINGANLLSLLQKHGYGLRIDLDEARRLLRSEAIQ